MPRISALSLAIVALTVGVAACGGSSGSSSTSSSSAPAPSSSSSSSSASGSGGGSTITDSADPSGQLKFTNSTLTAKAGKATVDFTNSSQLPHNMTIEDSSGKQVGATPTFAGGTKSFTVDLKPGKYTFFCSVPGHREAGMQGTLTVS
ncbi:MAG TPA: plastocyanin/azurin family copper-binding protein [Solirubrobacteraceae bacterium]|nr:plastocyanin/azurin family copper-binding protein [Solirubrobacteraceae bacterium]